MNETIILDTETTGVNFEQERVELLQLSIINDKGDTLYNGYFKPPYSTSWDKAQEVNHISPDMVADCPSVTDELPNILPIIQNAKIVVGYNTPFDVRVLAESGISFPDDVQYVDVMRDFAPIYGEWSEEKNDWKWKSLSVCAHYYGYDWGEDSAHNSLADCRATLYCYQKIEAAKELSLVSWKYLMPSEVLIRLCECRTQKSDLEILVGAKWRVMKAQNIKYNKKYTKEDALVSVLELLDSNSQFFDLSRDEYNELCHE